MRFFKGNDTQYYLYNKDIWESITSLVKEDGSVDAITSDRILQRDDKRLSQLGIKILEDTSKLPDIILYDADKNRIIYVEAYSSTGEFNKDRVDYINTYCSYKNDIEVAFVTAFATTKRCFRFILRLHGIQKSGLPKKQLI